MTLLILGIMSLLIGAAVTVLDSRESIEVFGVTVDVSAIGIGLIVSIVLFLFLWGIHTIAVTHPPA